MLKSALAFIFAIVAPLEAMACSPMIDYRVPTNIELLDDADLVVVASVRAGPVVCRRPDHNRLCFPTVLLAPQLVLKGVAPPELAVDGMLGERNGEAYLPVFTSLAEPHPSSMWGACTRRAYAEGALVIAMFDERDGEWHQLGYPFARSVEDVASLDALWVRAATQYLNILSTTPPDRRVEAFTQERDRLRAMSDDTDAQAIADDIDHFLLYGTDSQS